ncbi:MAG: SH3 domain-containing protein [Peptostreptococcaceae bacterium]
MIHIKKIITLLISLALSTTSVGLVFAEPSEDQTNEQSTVEQTEQQSTDESSNVIAKTQQTSQINKTMQVTGSSLNVRSGPDTTYSKLGSISKNTKVEVVEQSGIWYKVIFKNGYGWCSGDYLKDVSSNQGTNSNQSSNSNTSDNQSNSSTIGVLKTLQVTGSSLNVRSGPGTNYSRLGNISKNTKVEAIEQSGIWYKIKYKNGYGWCSGDYLKEVSSNQGTNSNQGSSSNQGSNSNTSNNQSGSSTVISTLYVTGSSLNIRSGPGTSYSRLGSLSKNTKVEAVEKSGIWYKIKYNNGYGWCSGDYLSTKTSSDSQGPTNVGSGYQIVIDTKSNNLWYYKDKSLVKQFRVATGKSSTQTPKGKFKVVNKIKNRPYYKLNIPGGDPRNPLGDRWLGLQVGSTYGTTYGIHGTNNESSIGKNVSGGCVRMYNAEVRWLFDQVPTGTIVTIK